MRRLIVGCLIVSAAVAAMWGAGAAAPGAAHASTTDLSVLATPTLVGAPVNVHVGFNLDPDADPVITLSDGVWSGTTIPSCMSGIGTAQVVIDDESCPPVVPPSQYAMLWTVCPREGVVTVTSSAPSAGSPSQVSFNCVRERPTETRRALLRPEAKSGAHGRATLDGYGDFALVDIATRGLPASAWFMVVIENDTGCGNVVDVATSDVRGGLTSEVWFAAGYFEVGCGTAPTRVRITDITGQTVLVGSFKK